MLKVQVNLKIGKVSFADDNTAEVEILANNKPLSPIYIVKNVHGQWEIQNRDHWHTMVIPTNI